MGYAHLQSPVKESLLDHPPPPAVRRLGMWRRRRLLCWLLGTVAAILVAVAALGGCTGWSASGPQLPHL